MSKITETPPLALVVRNVSLTIEGTPILSDVNWSTKVGANLAILGANGSGKSTLLRILLGYLYPTIGSVEVLGHRIGAVNLHELRRSVGFVDASSPCLIDTRLSTLDLALTGFYGHFCLDFDEPTAEQREMGEFALEQVGLASHRKQRLATLSVGELRRALLARVFVQRPLLLLLDEPTAGLDLVSRETLLATLERMRQLLPEMTVGLVTHHLEELSPTTTQVLVIRGGKILADGAPERVLTSEMLSEAFRCRVDVTRKENRWWWTVRAEAWGELLG